MYVAGIDAHSSYLVVAIVSKDGELVGKKHRIAVRQPERLLELLEKYRPLEVVVETSSAWPWLHDLLRSQGIGFVLAHARRLRLIAESNYKADEVDAELLARMHLAGLIPAVHPKAPEQREWSRLVRHRVSLVSKRTALANQIHGQLHQVGLGLPRGKLLTREGVQRIREEAWPKLGPEQRRMIRTHLKLIATLRPMVKSVDQRIEGVAAKIPAAHLLRTVPGIGAYRALLIAAEALPIERFEKAADLVAYSGLAPVTRSTGGRTRHGSLPRGANRWLRGALVRTVVSHIQQAPESWLSHYYATQKPRLGWQVARVATARKLCRALHAMLRTGTVWQGEMAEPERESSSERMLRKTA
ncbi:MAG TPA: IS110 family transposase [Longimicrobiaceae bacterium]|nr:IS110 family transposase [Longimicrobiaceae bacterium]